MTIEKANIIDCEILTEITKKSKGHWGYSPEQMLKWTNNLTISPDYIQTNTVFKLVAKNSIIGYYSFLREENNTVKLDNLFVLPAFIGKGFGKLLLTDFIKRMQDENCLKIILDSDPNAENFYLKMGFKTIGAFETSIKNRFMPMMEMKLENN